MIGAPMANTTPAANTSLLPVAGSAPPAAADASAAFVALLGETLGADASGVTPQFVGPAPELPTQPAQPQAEVAVAQPAAPAPVLPQILTELGMKAEAQATAPVTDPTLVAAAMPTELPSGDAAAQLDGDTGMASEDDQLTDEADPTQAMVDVSAFLPVSFVPAPVTAPMYPTQAADALVAPSNGHTAPAAPRAPEPSAVALNAAPTGTGGDVPLPNDAVSVQGAGVSSADGKAPTFDRAMEATKATADVVGPNDAAPAVPATAVGEVRHTNALAKAPVYPQIEMPKDPDTGFDDAMGARMTVMIDRGVSHARIRVSPEHLGTIDLQVSVDGDKVSAQFHSPHADVRTAIEGGLVRLRDHLADHGLQLAGAHVSSNGNGQAAADQQARQQNGGFAPTASNSGQGDGAPTEHVIAAPKRPAGLVDTYA